MGSGVFLAAVVLLWFIVLVPMVLTRRDTAIDKAALDNESPTARVLKRRTGATGTRRSRRSFLMSTSESSPSPMADHDLSGEIPQFVDDFDDMVDTGIHDRYVDDVEAHEPDPAPELRERGPRRTDSARERMLTRRRRTLIVLTSLIVVTLVVAIFLAPWVWYVNVVFDLMGVGYMWHLRNEARREEERRLRRESRTHAPSARYGFQDGAAEGRRSFAAGAFVATDEAFDQEVTLDDEDVAFYDVTDTHVAGDAVLSGHDYYAQAQDAPEYDYEDEAYGIHGTTSAHPDEDDWNIPHAV